MSCKINKNPQGKITGVKDQNGNDSTLFREIISNPHIDTNQAVEIYKETYSDKIKTENTNKSAETQDFFSDVVTGKSDKFKPNKPWKPILDFTKTEQSFKKIYDKFKGNFDEHIATSIPTFRETQIKVGSAIGKMFSTPIREKTIALQKIKEKYMESEGLKNQTSYKKVDKEFFSEIAEYHKTVKDDRNNPEMKKSYRAFLDETKAQYEMLIEAGYVIEPWMEEGEPYGVDSKAVRKDVIENKHLYYLRSKSATGDNNSQDTSENYMPFEDSGIVINGDQVLMNDLFRAVHDIMGHVMVHNTFSTQGEYDAYNTHAPMYSEQAQKALFLETVVYNAWYAKNKNYAPRKIYNIPNKFIEKVKEGVLVYDIGGSEGGFVKSITEQSNGNIKSINLDPNPDMQDVHEKNPVEGSEFVREAFYESFEDDGVIYKKHIPTQKADVVHESMVFQFITPQRKDFVKEVADNYIKENGIFLTEEKLLPESEEAWRQNEQNKNKHKLNYYSNQQLTQKSEEVLVGMKKNQTYRQQYIDILKEQFSFVEEYWDAGNFKGIIATNSKSKLDEFLNEIGGKITSEYSSVESTPETREEYTSRITKIKEKNPNDYWSVDIPSQEQLKNSYIYRTDGGMALLSKDGNLSGLFKDGNTKGVANTLQKNRINNGGIKTDNYDGYLTEIYKKNGFRVASRITFNEELAPDEWSKEKHGTPDVVFMIYDPQGQLNIEEKSFNKDQYEEAVAYRESFIEEAKTIHPYYKNQVEQQPIVVEPKLTYTTPTNENYPTFKKALQNTQTGEIQAKVGNVVLFSVDSSTDYNTYNGTLNGLIKSGILSGESVLEPTGEKVILTEGGHNIIKTINAVIAKEALIKAVGRKNVKETLDSNFILENKEGKVTLKNSAGENVDFDKTVLDDSSLDELQKQFPETYMEIVAMQEYKKLFKGFSEQSSEIEEIEFTPENELQSALIELLNKMGVKITSITDYITKFAKKNGVEPSASALADLTNKIVAFKDGNITTEDLSEEVAHFIVETFNEQEIENLLRNIHRTEEWQQHAENYFNIYRKNNPNISEAELERLVRKEILGKVLANSFVNGFNTEGKSETQGNIIQRILDLFNKFIEKITARFKDSYAVELENWTNQVNANLLSGELLDQLDMAQLEKGRFKMYSAPNNTSDPIVQINIRANKALNVLQSNMNNLREGGSKSELEQYRASLEKRDELSKLSAVSGIIGVVKRQTAYLKKAIEKNKDKNYPLSQEENSVFINTTGTMLGYMTEIKNLLDPNNKEHKRLIQEIDNLNKDILDIKGDKNILSDSAWKNMVERVAKKLSLTEEQKQTLLDAYIERVDENGNKIGGKGKKDTNWFFAHISSMVHAQDPALNMASDVISRMTMKHGVNTYNRVKNLFDKWEKLGITQPNKLLKKWKRGSYIMNPIRQDILDKEVLDKKTTLYNSIKGTSLTNEEFDKLEREDNLELTTEERLDFYEDIYEYRRKEHNVDYLTKEAREKRERMYDGLSKEAIRFDKNLSRERGQIGEEARKLDEYTQEHKYRLQQINKKRQRAKSPYNNEGQLKQGLIEVDGEIHKDPKVKELNKDSQMAIDLIELDKRKLEFFKEKNKEEKIIPEKFKKLLKDRLPETQLEYLLLNANISFSNEFWETLSEKDSFVDKLEKIESTSETVELINRIKSLQKRRNTILKANKVHNMPSEIDFSEMDGSDIEAVKDLSEQLQNAYKEAKLLLKESSEETNLTFSSVVNKAYLSELEAHGDNNSKEQEFEFIKDHVTTENKRSLNRTQVVAEDIISGRKDRLSDFYKTIFKEEYTGTEEEIREQVYNDLVEHAKGKLLPYFKRIEPNQGQSFTSIMEMLESGQKTPLQFIEEIENNLHPQIQVTPNYIFFEDTENQDLNPEYKRNEELGLPQIQEKYRDSEYESYFGITEYGGKATKNIEEYQALQALMEFHEETMEATGMTKRHNKYLLPQKGVRGARQIHKLFSQNNKLSTLKEIIKDATSFREDEKEYGENINGQSLGAKDGDLRIPKYGFNKLENQDDVTDELLESYIWMGSEAELYKARVEAFADMEAIKNLISNNTYSGKQGESSRIYKMFDSFYRYNIYGQNEEFSYETDFFGMLPKKYNIAPLAKKFQFWVRLVNLGFNLIVPLTSIFQGGVNLTIERFVGERIDKDASKLAKRELRKLLTEAVGDTLALNSKSRLNSTGEFLGVFDIDNRFKNSNYNRLSRGMLKTGFITHTLADAPIKAQIMMSVLKDMRAVNGDVLNFNQFMAQKKATLSEGESLDKKAIRTEWRKYEDKTFDKYLTTHNGITDIEAEKLLEDLGKEGDTDIKEFLDNKLQFIRDTIRRTAQEVDTMIPMEEKSFAQRHAIFSFFFLHRGWMSVAYNRKFKSRHINTHTGLTEEGNWWGTSDFIKQWINEWRNPENSKTFLKTVKDMWDNADDTTRRSINRTLIELAVTNSLAVLSLIMMGLADDQDDDAWMAQFSAYMGYRVSNEVISSTVAYPRQIGEFIESPIVGWDKLKGLSDMFDLLDGDIVERGKYKGETEKMRFIYKSLPAFKEYYNVKNAHDTRNTYEFYNTQNFNWAWSSYLIGQNQE